MTGKHSIPDPFKGAPEGVQIYLPDVGDYRAVDTFGSAWGKRGGWRSPEGAFDSQEEGVDFYKRWRGGVVVGDTTVDFLGEDKDEEPTEMDATWNATGVATAWDAAWSVSEEAATEDDPWAGSPDGERFEHRENRGHRVVDAEGRSWVLWRGSECESWHLYCQDGNYPSGYDHEWVSLGHFVDGVKIPNTLEQLHDNLTKTPGIGGWNDLPVSLGGLGPEVEEPETDRLAGFTNADLLAELTLRLRRS